MMTRPRTDIDVENDLLRFRSGRIQSQTVEVVVKRGGHQHEIGGRQNVISGRRVQPGVLADGQFAPAIDAQLQS